MDSFPPRYRFAPIAVILAVLLFNTPGSAADAPAVKQERVVALTESVGYQIDPVERERYGLFSQRTGFLLAEFLLRDGEYWLRISYRSDGERFVEQSQLAEAQFLAWRQSVLAIDGGPCVVIDGNTVLRLDDLEKFAAKHTITKGQT